MSNQDLFDKDLHACLQALKGAMQDVKAPDRVEAALVAAFRERAERRQARPWLRWALAAAAMLVASVTGSLVFLNRAPSRPEPVAVRPAAPATTIADASPSVSPAAPAMPAPAVKAMRRPVAERPETVQTAEFIPLLPDPAWMPGESAQIMRVSMPRTALQSLGLPVDESRAFEQVRADIIVGQDMVARAIRIVR
jgi:hypothetical protein